MAHLFTVEEANAALKIIRPLVAQILEIRQSILGKRPQVWPVLQNALGNGGNREASLMAEEFEQLQTLVQEIQATGALLKDVNLGLVDFPALRDGRQVYLCWQYGEDGVQYWHEMDAGYAGRQKI